MNFPAVLLVLPSFFFFACEQILEFNPVLPLKGNYVIYEEYISSSRLEEVRVESLKEEIGTMFEIHTKVSVIPNDKGTQILWEPNKFISNGWNKSLLADIHQKKTGLKVQLNKKGELIEITGFSELPAILDKVNKDKVLKKRLLQDMDTLFYKNIWWDRWILSTFLKTGNYKPLQKLPLDNLNSKLKTLKVDSIIIKGERNPRIHPCIEYSVHYTKRDSFNLEFEEFLTVHKNNLLSHTRKDHISKLQIQTHNFIDSHEEYGKVVKKGLVDDLQVIGTWRFSVSLSTGLPCYEFKKEEAHVVLTDSISNKITVTFYRTIENGFKAF